MLEALQKFFRSCLGQRRPRFSYLQVEVTTRCNLPGCRMCPRSAYHDRWQTRDLAWPTFNRFLPLLSRCDQVHLSGWGEPLLHPRLWEMARLARTQGCKVSLTTNAMGLTAAVRAQALEHLDMVAISLDGARAATYESLRPGADFYRVTRQIAALCRGKQSLGTSRPEIVLLFMKMRPNLAELPEFLELAASLGVDRVNATNLDYIPAPAMESLSLIAPGPPAPAIEAVLQQAEEKAAALGLAYRNFPLQPTLDLLVCDADPLHNAFVTVSGDLAPCVYLGLPVTGVFSRHYFGQAYPACNYSYGNLEIADFPELCRQSAYRQFVRYFQNRASGLQNMLGELGRPAPPLTSPQTARQPPPGVESHYSWPPACQGCYKMLGI